ncbi:hypothetical protein C7C46_02820 [Streptomyces tateyamensis]|uniref:Cation/H+ exchanger transmembrane domain-containing protein n=1 Tax=Streptomyces tateyamensis TaxID=565073 RepID=A0A2V4P9Z7_9ACTN|nr:hypothetical protein C7C46_02820 [Streptomyces tateyamensis]
MSVLLAVAKLFGSLARRARQPAVVGEIVAGVCCGPLLLPASVRHTLVPPDVQPLLGALAALGLALFMFVLGYELEHTLLRGLRGSALGVAAGSVTVPLALGILLALPLAKQYAPGSKTGFVLFLGIAMSVTAFPVLARVLADRRLTATPIGVLALVSAAFGDLVAWITLAGVVVLFGTTPQWRISLLPVYVLVLLVVVRPLLERLLGRRTDGAGDRLPPTLFPLLVVGLLTSCAAAEWLGVHYIFGAFAFGAVMPRSGFEDLRRHVTERANHIGALLLPLYFVVAGLKVDLHGLGPASLLTLTLILLVAVAGKAAGVYGGARLSGVDPRLALPLTALMNMRGLTELVILSVGLELHLINSTVYSMMVVMAVVTTAMAGPVLDTRRFAIAAQPADDVPPLPQQPRTARESDKELTENSR